MCKKLKNFITNLFSCGDDTDKLYVITTLFNPYRYKRRYELHNQFTEYMLNNPSVVLVSVECSITIDGFDILVEKRAKNHIVIHVPTTDEIWMKENLINIGIAHLPKKAQYVAWIDADLTFLRHDWVEETIEQLQRYDMVQMFSNIINLSPSGEMMNAWWGTSWMEGYRKAYSEGKIKDCCETYTDGVISTLPWQGSPGGAWAAKRHIVEQLPLIDFVITGSADYYMALGLVGCLQIDKKVGYNKKYTDLLLEWQEDALRIVNHNVGVVKGVVAHSWHGKMSDRGYDERWKILVTHNYDPTTDVQYQENGIIHLTGDNWRLREDLRHYFSRRNEDCINTH